MIRSILATGAVLAAAACASPTDPAPSQQASATTRNCIEPSRVRDHEVISNDEIHFTLAGGEVWSNKLPRSCPGLKAQGGFTWDVSNTSCAGTQIIYVNESGIPCTLGEFTRSSAGPAHG